MGVKSEAPASSTPCLFGFNSTDHCIENSQLGLLDRCDRVVDGECGFALQPICTVLCALDIALMLKLGNVSFHVVYISGYLRLQRAPLLAGSVLGRFDVFVHLFECRGGRSTRLLSAGHHLVVRFLLYRSDGILGILGASGKICELLRKRFSHVRSPSSRIPSTLPQEFPYAFCDLLSRERLKQPSMRACRRPVSTRANVKIVYLRCAIVLLARQPSDGSAHANCSYTP